MQEVLEQLDSFMRLVAYAKYWADYLALHLAVDQDDVLLVVNDIADFPTNLPNLRPQLVHYIFEYILVPESVDLAEDDDDRHLELERDPKLVEDALLEFVVLLCAVESIHHDQGVVGVVVAEATHQSLRVSLVATDVDEGDDLGAVLDDLGHRQEARKIGNFAVGVEADDMVVNLRGLAMHYLLDVLVHILTR